MKYRLDEASRRALFNAAELANEVGDRFIETQHILLGLIRTHAGETREVLKSIGNIDDLITSAFKTIGGDTPKTQKIRPSEGSREVLFMAAREAADDLISPIDLLLGILQIPKDEGHQLLQSFGVTDPALRASKKEKGEGRRTERVMDEALKQFTTDLTAKAESGQLDPLIGCSDELQRIMLVLKLRRNNCPVLLGDSGVGKTAIILGLAQLIADGDAPDYLHDRQVLKLNIGEVLAIRGEAETRLKDVLKACADINAILVIDDFHQICRTGRSDSPCDPSHLLEAAVGDGLQVIAATTYDHYKKTIERDSTLKRLFQPVKIEAANIETTVRILEGLQWSYQYHHSVNYTPEMLRRIAVMAERFLTRSALPDKAIYLMDKASAQERIWSDALGKEADALRSQIAELKTSLRKGKSTDKFAERRETEDKLEELTDDLDQIRKIKQNEAGWKSPTVSISAVAAVIHADTGIAVNMLSRSEEERLLEMEQELCQRVVGQQAAVHELCDAIILARLGFKDPKRPVGSFLFLGPTGVGKTELARILAEYLFGSQNDLIRLDMSEFMEKHEAAKLIGSPPGYVRCEEGGQLTEAVSRKPYSIVLLDEIEKAHADVLNLLLQVMEDGRLTDGLGKTVDFKNTIVIMTSNIAARTIAPSSRRGTLGFAAAEDSGAATQMKKLHEKVMAELKRTLTPEFLNRIDAIAIFNALGEAEIESIIDLLAVTLHKGLAEHKLELRITNEAKRFLMDNGGFDTEYGARPMRRTIKKYLEASIAKAILRHEFQDGDLLETVVGEDALSFKVIGRAA